MEIYKDLSSRQAKNSKSYLTVIIKKQNEEGKIIEGKKITNKYIFLFIPD